jgi:AcrR family transcriptional regulator
MVERAAQKRETRRRITETAFDLFARHGFDGVTVADVATAAGVTEKTVFNHFRSKEDLVYSEDAAFQAALLDAVGGRPPREPALSAARAFFLRRYERVKLDPDGRRRAAVLAELVAASPALRARESDIHARYAEALAGLIATEQDAAPDDLRPRLAAEAIVAVHRQTVAVVRRALLAGAPDEEVAARALRASSDGFALLGGGLGRYAAKPARRRMKSI